MNCRGYCQDLVVMRMSIVSADFGTHISSWCCWVTLSRAGKRGLPIVFPIPSFIAKRAGEDEGRSYVRDLVRIFPDKPGFGKTHKCHEKEGVAWGDLRARVKGVIAKLPCPHSSGVGWRVRAPVPSDVADAQLDCRTGNSSMRLCGNQPIVPHFIQDILNAYNYRQFLETDLPLSLRDVLLAVGRDMWLQQDGVPPHFSRAVTEFLNAEYPSRWLGRGGPTTWQPRYHDLSHWTFLLRLPGAYGVQRTETRHVGPVSIGYSRMGAISTLHQYCVTSQQHSETAFANQRRVSYLSGGSLANEESSAACGSQSDTRLAPRCSRSLKAVHEKPPRRTELNPLDFYLWGHLKTLVYATPVNGVNSLRKRIEAGCEAIRNFPGILQRIQVSIQRRVDACVRADGWHFEHFL
ncbi:hypothetical protein PR048_011841 [Dryococelus australis]|uniref:Transposase n=1 Tax=Dryococelus australis TaxID=614101 RepID=A0ABQ9HMR8_9NEOP|nr:hypothetical protein PR048_011841 [Dryococelus australis]